MTNSCNRESAVNKISYTEMEINIRDFFDRNRVKPITDRNQVKLINVKNATNPDSTGFSHY